MPECRNCSHPVSHEYARVCGDNDREVWACPDCVSQTRARQIAHNPALEADDVIGGSDAQFEAVRTDGGDQR